MVWTHPIPRLKSEFRLPCKHFGKLTRQRMIIFLLPNFILSKSITISRTTHTVCKPACGPEHWSWWRTGKLGIIHLWIVNGLAHLWINTRQHFMFAATISRQFVLIWVAYLSNFFRKSIFSLQNMGKIMKFLNCPSRLITRWLSSADPGLPFV